MAIPDLALYEIANVLRYQSTFSESKIGEAIKSVYDMKMEIYLPEIDTLTSSLKIALDFGITIYDAVFAFLAKNLGVNW